jgi:hypothetical protein
MDSSLSALIPNSGDQSLQPFLAKASTRSRVTYNTNILVIQASFGSNSQDQVNVGIDNLSKALSVKADKIISKLNELLKDKLPDGIQSLKPEDTTPEATSDRIVGGVTAFFDQFAKQNPDLSGEDLLKKFMDTVRSGIQSGYDDASQTLQDLGAFEFDGVKAGIDKTKDLIEKKLQAFETQKRKDLGLIDPQLAQDVAASTNSELLKQAGGSINVVA